jgi:flagellar hook-length control protein FliK
MLTALPSAGKSASSAAGASSQKAARQVAETVIDPAAPDAACTPEDSPNFAKMLRDQTAAERAADPTPASAVDAKADTHTDTAIRVAATPQTSEQLSAWLASLMGAPSALKEQDREEKQAQVRAQSPETGRAPALVSLKAESALQTPVSETVQTALAGLDDAHPAVLAQTPGMVLGANPALQAKPPTGAEQLTKLAGQAGSGSASASPARGDPRTALAKGAMKPANRLEAPEDRAPDPANLATAREAAKTKVEVAASPAAAAPTGGQKSLAAGAVPDTSAAHKPGVQRSGAADLNLLPMALAGLTPNASAAPALASPIVETAISQDIRRPEFVPVFSARIATLVQEGVEQARVHLNPVDMGPVSLQLSMEGLQVRVDMTAEVATTRQVLEQAMPTLAGALREAGFTLSGGGVSPPGEAANAGGQDARGSSASQGDPSPQSSSQSAGLSGQASDGRRSPEAEPGRRSFADVSGTAEVLTTELHLDAQGRPRLASGRGLVDTFA